MTDELTTDLARIRSLRVISRTTAMHYKGTTEPLPQIARELRVDAVVEGSISRSGSEIRVRAQLVRAAADEHIWANTYERKLTDAVALQAEVASDIANEIEVNLSPRERKALASRKPVNPQAYDAYLRGRYFFDKRTPVSDQKSISDFQQAIALDPSFAPAYAGLADAMVFRSYSGDALPAETMPQAKSLVAKALAIDEDLPDAHVSSGWIKLTYDWDWPGAEQESKRALELSPNSAAAHQLYGNYLLAIGHTDAAIVELQRSCELDPLSLFINRDLGRALYYDRHYDDALKQLKQTLDLDPNMGAANEWISWSYEEKGLRDQALDAFLRAELADGAGEDYVRAQEGFYKRSGWRAFWQHVLIQYRTRSRGSVGYLSALAYVWLGDKQKALEVLQEQVKLRTVWVTWMNIDPQLDSLRPDPQFQQMLRATGR
ncbi:MAG: tetratricopeptide repeat protein [Candidatus Acidiferrales bacterium]